MFRPISFTKNDCSLILMKNRRESLMEVDTDLIDSITFNVKEPAKLSMTIPSHISRNGVELPYPLYDIVQGKMQMVLEINSNKYKFIIDDISESNKKGISTKTLTCYEWQYTLQKLNFMIGDPVVTRQLYRGDNQLEVSEGILDWFEQYCAGWRVAYVDQKAQQELTLCATSEKVELHKDLTINQVRVNTEQDNNNWLLNKNVNINIGEKPLNMSISWDCEVYDANDKLYLSTTSTHNFSGLPYAIKNIKAEYISTLQHMYGIQYTITYVNNRTDSFTFDFLNCKGLKLKAKTVNVIYELGDLVENWVTKYRTFEAQSCSWTTMLSQVEEAFDCIITFDSYNQTISVYDKDSFGQEVGLTLSFDNAIQEISKQKKIGDIVSRLTVESSNTSIAGVNPLGTEYIESFTYFKTHNIMSQDLINAIDDFEKLVEEKDIEFMTLKLQKHEKDQALTLENSRLKSLEGQYTAENSILTGYIKAFNSAEKSEQDKWAKLQSDQQAVVVGIENEISSALSRIQTLKDEISTYEERMIQIGIDIKKENAVYQGRKLFNDELLLELNDYIVESTLSNDVYLTASALYNHAVKTLEDMQSVYVDFTIKADVDFLNRLQTPKGFSDFIFLGAKIAIEDTSGELTSEDGLVTLYGYTYTPKTNAISNLQFTNNKETPVSSIKTIGSIAQTTNATKSLTDFYKASWEDTRKNNVDVGKIINEGLDLAAQKVRSRTDKNVIEMDEAGIFLIDATDNNNQLALINDLIAMTTDRWKTSKIAISPEGIMAEQLLGQIILSEEVYVGNADNTFKILPEGLYVYDQNSSHELRVFLGIKDGKAKLELYSASGDNSLVLSENGIYSCYQISDRDSFDYHNSFKSHFYVPSTLEKTFEAKLVVRLEKFRAYSKASQSEKIDLKSTESEKIRLESTESEKINLKSTESEKINLESTNTQSFAAKSTVGSGSISVNVSGVSGGSTPVTVSGSGKSTSQSYNFTTGTHGGVVSGTTSAPYGSANGDQGNIHMESHYHWFKLSHSHDTSANCGQHAHSITISGTASANNHTHDFTVPTHSHTITMPSHSHSIVMPSHSHSIVMPSHTHNIVMPPHGHELEYGIFEHGVVPNCRVYLNGVDLGITMNQEREYSIDITNQFKALQKGLNTIEIKTTDAKGLCRASFTMFWGGYFSYH